MTTLTTKPGISERALNEIREYTAKLAGEWFARRLWERRLTAHDRKRLGGDVKAAYEEAGIVDWWIELRGVTRNRAVLDLAKKLDCITQEDYEWLLREIGESTDIDEAILTAIARNDLVLVERPRAAYWMHKEIDIDWNRYSAPWEFFWESGRQAKAGLPIDSFTFSDDAHRDIVTKRKSRLVNMPEYPADLTDRFERVNIGTQQLNVPREQIRIFQLDGHGDLVEWFP